MIVLLLLALSFAGEFPANRPVGQLSVSPHYVVSAGDVLTLEVFGEPELSRDLRVSDKGSISIPNAGTIQAAGLNLDQLEQLVVDRLGASILVSPQVTLGVRSYANSVEVTGQVRNVGLYPITDANMTVRAILTSAGGTENNIPRIYLQRGAQQFELDLEAIANGNTTADMVVQPGDVIMVPPPPTVQVVGEVKEPQLVPYKTHMRLTAAIAEAGGLSQLANKRGILLTRDPSCKITEPVPAIEGEPIRVDYVKIRKQQDPDPELCPNDKIEVLQSAI
jgi:polysaccharide export outer membrane protein